MSDIFKWETVSAELAKKLQKSNVSKHPYNGNDYIQAWHAIAEANRIFGFGEWSMETVYNKEVCRFDKEIGSRKDAGFCVGYEAKVRITIGDIVREGTGHGSGNAKDLFDCIEGAAKEAESDAMKRALKSFGNQFGLALYDKKKANVTDVKEPTKEEKGKKAAEFSEGIIISINAMDSEANLDDLKEINKGWLNALKAYPELHAKVNAALVEQYAKVAKANKEAG